MSAPPPYYGQQQGAYPAYPQYGQNVQYVYPQGTVYTAQPTTVIVDDCHSHHHHHCDERGGGGDVANACCLAALAACLCACYSAIDMDSKVYVGGLPNDATSQELEDVFYRFGRIRKVWVARRPPGFAFVEFEDGRDAEDAVKALDGSRICGVRARVELSHGRRRNGGSGGGGGGGGGGGYSSGGGYGGRR
ncbi:hypothetical protein WR25_25964 [Diploscapter pachys]|uniref:RRM domain-containing protein n=1 Tax=Diploscapter pachys TaxID=2018661 RepID=A0A2A2KSF4_9BILA|nr:hypothetical protein WR25_25964 [Diploscapter pachys]